MRAVRVTCSALAGSLVAVMSEAATGSQGAARSAAPGLVSEPTTRKMVRYCPGEAVALRDGLGAIGVLDPSRVRLTRLRQTVGLAARLHEAETHQKGFRACVPWLVTLTYRPSVEWRPEHVSRAIECARQWAKSNGHGRLRYTWVAELQERGAVHYHLCVWLPPGVRMPKWDVRVSRLGSAWWPHGMTNRKIARHAVAYLCKYMSKGSDYTAFPKGARIYGVGGLSKEGKGAARWQKYPSFVQSRASIHDHWRRATGGGWSSPDGEWFCSEFQRVHVAGLPALIRVADHGRPFPADGPRSWVSDRPKGFLSSAQVVH
jgi:hypothetical protein